MVAVGDLEAHVQGARVLELERLVGQEDGDLDVLVPQVGGGNLVLGEDAADRAVANRPGRSARRIVTMEELLGHPAVTVDDVDAREGNAVETPLGGPVEHIRVGVDRRVQNAEALDDRRVDVGEQVIGDALSLGKGLQVLL